MNSLSPISIINSFTSKRILVIGDIILDHYIFGDVERISPEAPIPIVHFINEEYKLGGAGNVALNINSIGGVAILMGIIGCDENGARIKKLLGDNNLLIEDETISTIIKTRVIAQRQQIVRIDREKPIVVNSQILKRFDSILSRSPIDGVIISDYAKGTINRDIIEKIKQISINIGVPIIADPKPKNAHIYKDLFCITPNLKEAEAICGWSIRSISDIESALLYLKEKLNLECVVITRGGSGVSALKKTGEFIHLPAHTHDVFDVTGAGDTLVSVLTLAICSGADLIEALKIANTAASIVVERIGATQVVPIDLIKRLNNGLIGEKS